jgi:hypothetical protein
MDPGSERKSSRRSIWKGNRTGRNVQTADDDKTSGSTKEVENSLKSGRTDASLQPSTNSSSTESPYRLFILHDQANDRSNAMDIIAVHGLNGHYEKTWQETGPNGQSVNWLRDFLPSQIPYARIMSYGYNSTVLFSKSEADFGTFAEQLLEDILSWRTRGMVRPIIFICHSLGGIVFKKVGPQKFLTNYHSLNSNCRPCYEATSENATNPSSNPFVELPSSAHLTEGQN